MSEDSNGPGFDELISRELASAGWPTSVSSPQVEEPPHLFVLSRSVCPQVKVNPILVGLLVSNSSDLEPKAGAVGRANVGPGVVRLHDGQPSTAPQNSATSWGLMATIEIAAIRLVMPEAMRDRCETSETDPRHHIRRRLIPELDGLLRGHQTCRMEPRLTLISLVVRDLVVSRRFYIDGLGWPIEFEAPEEVVMVRLVPGVVLSLWQEDKAKGELGTIGRTPDALPFALAHNVGSEAEVDAVLEEARAAGASIPTHAIGRDWGGYSGYFVDPDGFRWEVAYNPGL